MPNAKRFFFLAIRRKTDGAFLPSVRGYGFTRTEPSLIEPPRLFEKPGPCRQALNRWLEGELYEGTESDEGMLTLRHISRPDRRRADFEIVEIELVPRSLSEAALRIL